MTPAGELLLDTLRLMTEGDLDRCVARLTPDFAMHHAGHETQRGAALWRAGAEAVLTAFPDLRIDVDDVVAHGDLVAIRARIGGTHLGPWFGAAPTGRPVSYVSHEFYRVSGDLLAEEWICSDTASLAAQLG
jgi:predicted ester cyclase